MYLYSTSARTEAPMSCGFLGVLVVGLSFSFITSPSAADVVNVMIPAMLCLCRKPIAYPWRVEHGVEMKSILIQI